jgi:[NiFe] hydrogenase assembly HybE family chaperone
MTQRFEGSFLGDVSRIGGDAVLECKICWYSYDPAQGDEVRQIAPGTPFAALPEDWRCPQCDGDREQFMVVDAGQARVAEPKAAAAEKAQRLAAAFRDIHQNKMRDTPFVNRSLNVEAIGFRPWEGRILGVLVAPWFMNLIIMPGPDQAWPDFAIGEKRVLAFPSGDYEFIYNAREPVGPYFSCALFSPMNEFSSQLQAAETARAVLAALFDEKTHAEGDAAETIREMRVAELERQAGSARPANAAPTRRALITGRLAERPEEAAQ